MLGIYSNPDLIPGRFRGKITNRRPRIHAPADSRGGGRGEPSRGGGRGIVKGAASATRPRTGADAQTQRPARPVMANRNTRTAGHVIAHGASLRDGV